jgi:hypothetical protein
MRKNLVDVVPAQRPIAESYREYYLEVIAFNVGLADPMCTLPEMTMLNEFNSVLTGKGSTALHSEVTRATVLSRSLSEELLARRIQIDYDGSLTDSSSDVTDGFAA